MKSLPPLIREGKRVGKLYCHSEKTENQACSGDFRLIQNLLLIDSES